MRRKQSEIIADLKRIWGENWETNMSIISDAIWRDQATIPQAQIDESNNLIWEMMGTREYSPTRRFNND